MKKSYGRKITWTFVSVMLAIGIVFTICGGVAEAGECPSIFAQESRFWFSAEQASCCGMLGYAWGGDVWVNSPLFKNRLTIEGVWEESVYGASDFSYGLGLRGMFSNSSFGVGIGENFYGLKKLYAKGYGWVSIYEGCFFGKLYYEETICCGFGKMLAIIDWHGRPLGIDGLYILNLTPSGKYKEGRGTMSLSLAYPRNVCYESDCDADVRCFGGLKIASFDDDQEPFRILWQGYVAGVRFFVPWLEVKAEYQWLWRYDSWHSYWYRDDRFVLSASVTLGALCRE